VLGDNLIPANFGKRPATRTLVESQLVTANKAGQESTIDRRNDDSKNNLLKPQPAFSSYFFHRIVFHKRTD